jgi:hypothetical protein
MLGECLSPSPCSPNKHQKLPMLKPGNPEYSAHKDAKHRRGCREHGKENITGGNPELYGDIRTVEVQAPDGAKRPCIRRNCRFVLFYLQNAFPPVKCVVPLSHDDRCIPSVRIKETHSTQKYLHNSLFMFLGQFVINLGTRIFNLPIQKKKPPWFIPWSQLKKREVIKKVNPIS